MSEYLASIETIVGRQVIMRPGKMVHTANNYPTLILQELELLTTKVAELSEEVSQISSCSQ